MLIKYCNDKKMVNKNILWNSFGDTIIKNLQSNIPANTKLCEVCGERFEYNTNSCKPTLYCKKCAERIKTEKDKARIKQNRLIKK